MMVENEIMMCEKKTFAVIGLDAEWSPYVGQSKASVLQIGFNAAVYLVDLEAMCKHPRLIKMLDNLFLSKAYKIGFQFTEDLIQIRNCVSSCESLYHPENLFCISSLISQVSSIINTPIYIFFKFSCII